jgi:hypothetical protein
MKAFLLYLGAKMQTLATLPPGKNPLNMRMCWRREKSLIPARVQTLDCPTCSIVTGKVLLYPLNMRMGWRREKSHAPARVQTLDCPTCSVVTGKEPLYLLNIRVGWRREKSLAPARV